MQAKYAIKIKGKNDTKAKHEGFVEELLSA
jgi:hypothetical protein